MKCPKCSGLINTEIIIAENQWIKETYCVNCGKRIHPDILTTRQRVIETPKDGNIIDEGGREPINQNLI